MRNLIISFLTVMLVSFSVCAAQQSQQGINTTPQSPPTTLVIKPTDVKTNEQGTKPAELKPNELAPNPTQASSTNETPINPKPVTVQQTSSTQGVTTANTEVPAASVQTAKQNDSKSEINNQTPTEKAEADTQKPSENVAPTKQTITDGTKPTETADKPVNDTKTDGKGKSDATTSKNETVKPTEAPEAKQVQATRAFDGASFVGGIVLTLGLLGISFVGFKYYKNLTKENYHIL